MNVHVYSTPEKEKGKKEKGKGACTVTHLSRAKDHIQVNER